MTSPQIYIEETGPPPPRIERAPTGIAAFVGTLPKGPVAQPVICRSQVEFEALFGACDAAFPTGLQVRQFFINGGLEARVCRSAPGAAVTDVAAAATLVDGFDVLCAPDLSALVAGLHTEVVSSLLVLMQERRAFLVLDPPANALDQAGILAWRENGIAALGEAVRHAATYYPRVLVAEPQGGTIMLGPCGTLAGIYARTDRDRGVWKAPADAMQGVSGLELTVGMAAQDSLGPLGINILRRVTGRGLQVGGARTLLSSASTAPSDRYVSLRRLALMIERSLVGGLQWAVFEPNGAPLWAKLRVACEDFMRSLWQDGALQGAKPELAFLCRCGRDTTTLAEFDQGLVRLEVGYAALKPGEFELIRLTLQTAGSL